MRPGRSLNTAQTVSSLPSKVDDELPTTVMPAAPTAIDGSWKKEKTFEGARSGGAEVRPFVSSQVYRPTARIPIEKDPRHQ